MADSQSASSATETYHNYIDGAWVPADAGATFEVANPAAPSETVAVFPESDREDAAAAVEAAAAAAQGWADTPAPQRGAILQDASHILKHKKAELVETLVREEGKTRAEADGEVQRAIDIFAYYGQRARDFGGTTAQSSGTGTNLYTVREPLGVAALITPWNYPSAIPAWKLGPALATGNSVVFKPASAAPTIAAKLVEALDEAGLPDGVLNMVTGPGKTVGDEFMSNGLVDAVSFTGSSKVGEIVYETATEDGKRVQCEMGGKNPTVVTDSADLDRAVEIVGSGAFGVTGQACTACSRAIVDEAVYDEFVEGIVDYAESLEIGPGLEDPDMGPHVSEAELEGSLEYIDIAQTEGATLATGGEALTEGAYAEGHYIEPTVFTDVTSEMRIAQEEVFGPVLAVLPVSGFEEGLAVANDVEYGLSASIVTQNHTEANEFIDRIESGVAKVNEKTTGLELHVPFGGVKRSSTNTYREQGEDGMEFFTQTKTVYDNY
ncbi:MAG: aldehyde dehydrogenase family protein [Halobacteriaceae archaeon]